MIRLGAAAVPGQPSNGGMQMEIKAKPIWLSKTFWVNIVALVAMAVQIFTGFVIDLEAQALTLAFVNLALRIITKSPVTWSDQDKSTLKASIWILPLAVLIAAGAFLQTGCGTISQNGWHQQIADWTPHQKANFFMETWRSEHATYTAQNAIEEKSPELVRLLKMKREVLERSRIPIRIYAGIVDAGGRPDVELEQEVIGWIRELQMQALSKGNGS